MLGYLILHLWWPLIQEMQGLSFVGSALKLRLAVPNMYAVVCVFPAKKRTVGVFMCLVESNSVSDVSSKSYMQY